MSLLAFNADSSDSTCVNPILERDVLAGGSRCLGILAQMMMKDEKRSKEIKAATFIQTNHTHELLKVWWNCDYLYGYSMIKQIYGYIFSIEIYLFLMMKTFTYLTWFSMRHKLHFLSPLFCFLGLWKFHSISCPLD